MARQQRSTPVDIKIGERIRTKRLAMKMSQTNLADKIGITFQQVQKYEKGANRLSGSRAVMVAKALNVSPSFFFDGVDARDGTAGAQMGELTGLIRDRRALLVLEAFNELPTDIRGALVDMVQVLRKKLK